MGEDTNNCQWFTFLPHFSPPQFTQSCRLKSWSPQLKRETWHLFLSFPSFILPTLHIPYTCKPSLTHTYSPSLSFSLCHTHARKRAHLKSFFPVTSHSQSAEAEARLVRVCFMESFPLGWVMEEDLVCVGEGGGDRSREERWVRQRWRQKRASAQRGQKKMMNSGELGGASEAAEVSVEVSECTLCPFHFTPSYNQIENTEARGGTTRSSSLSKRQDWAFLN